MRAFQFAAALALLTLSQVALATDSAVTWDEDQIDALERYEKTVSLRLPPSSIGRSLLAAMDLLLEELVTKDLVNRVSEAPALSRLQSRVKKETVVLEKYGDFSKRSIAACARVVSEIDAAPGTSLEHPLRDVLQDLVAVSRTRGLGIKLLRLTYELEQRCL